MAQMPRGLLTFAAVLLAAAAATGVVHQLWNVWLVCHGQATRHEAIDSIYVGGMIAVALAIGLACGKK